MSEKIDSTASTLAEGPGSNGSTREFRSGPAAHSVRTRCNFISPFRLRRLDTCFCIVGLSLALSGCAALPDVKPYVEASEQLAVSIRAVGKSSTLQTSSAALASLPIHREELTAMANQLDEAWAKHISAIEAAAAYARSVQEVAEAGNAGAQSARKVADAALNLANAANVAVGTAGKIAADAFVLIYQQIARARARRTLIASMHAVQPAIEESMKLLAESLGDLSELVMDMAQLRVNALRRSLGNEIGFRQSLEEARNGIYEKQRWGTMDDGQRDELERVEKAIAETDKWYIPFDEERRAILAEQDAAVGAIRASAQGTRDWADMHQNLLDTLEQGSGIDATELMIMVAELQELVERMRESRAPLPARSN